MRDATMSPTKLSLASSPPAGAGALPLLRSTVRGPIAAAIVCTAILASTAGIEVARSWMTPPHVFAEAGHAFGGVMVAVFVLGAIGVATRSRPLGRLALVSTFALLAHGVTLVLRGEVIGGLFVGLAPIVGVLAHLAFTPIPATPEPPSSARVDIAWAIAKSRRARAHTARRRATSPNRSAMHA